MFVNEKELSTEIKNGTLNGVYFLWGDEDYLKKIKVDEMRKSVLGDDPSGVSMNSYSFFYGEKDCEFGEVDDAFLAPPFLSERKFIHISFVSLDSMKDSKIEDFMEIIREYSSDDTTVTAVSVYKDGITAQGKNKVPQFINKHTNDMKFVEFPLRSDKDLNGWIKKHFSAYGLSVDDRVVTMITNVCGREMWTLKGEIEKCSAYIAESGRHEVTANDIMNCMSKTDLEDVFALANAVSDGNTAEALYYLQMKLRKKEEPVVVLGQISKAFSTLCLARAYMDEGKNSANMADDMNMGQWMASKYFAAAAKCDKLFFEQIMGLCSDADRLVKSGGDYMALERLVCLSTRRRK